MEENNRKTPPERIGEMLKFAIANDLADSKTAFAALLEITPETLSRFLSGKREPSKHSWSAFNAKLGKPFNEDWLLTGIGDPRSQTPLPITPQTPSTIDMLIQELREQRIAKDEQIDRLLSIIENMQTK